LARLLLAALVLIAASSCDIQMPGQRGYDVTLVNRMDKTIIVYLRVPDLPANAALARGLRLEPGGRFADHWLVPTGVGDARRAVVTATDTSGTTLYCRAYSWAQLKGEGFGLELRAGVLEC